MAGSSNDNDDVISAINVTPFVDIVLVLLIILMVTSTHIVKASFKVDLPKAASGGAAVESTMYESFSREMRKRSVTGRIVVPISNELA